MKNTLAENLLRFGVKNLSESDKIRITEATAQVVKVTFMVPYINDGKGNLVYTAKSATKFIIENLTGKGTYTSLKDFQQVAMFSLDGTAVKPIRSSADAKGRIIGEMVIPTDAKQTINFLGSVKDKSLPINDERVKVTLRKTQQAGGGVEILTVIPAIFTSYDPTAATPTAPR